MKARRSHTYLPRLISLEDRCLLAGATWANPVQSGDFTNAVSSGSGGSLGASDFKDVKFDLNGLRSQEINYVRMRINGQMFWEYAKSGLSREPFTSAAAMQRNGTDSVASIYFEPLVGTGNQSLTSGKVVNIEVVYASGSPETTSLTVSSTIDPLLRADGKTLGVTWNGQVNEDWARPGMSVGPDGKQDVKLSLSGLTLYTPWSPQNPGAYGVSRAVLRVVDASGNPDTSVDSNGRKLYEWVFGYNPEGSNTAELIRSPVLSSSSTGSLYFSPMADLSGKRLALDITYDPGLAADKKHATYYIDANRSDRLNDAYAGHTDPNRPWTAVGAAPSIPQFSGSATWAGQASQVPGYSAGVGRGYVKVQLANLPSGVSVVGSVLSSRGGGKWYSGTADVNAGGHSKLIQSGTTADLYFSPSRSETNDLLTLTLWFSDQTKQYIQISGQAVDFSLLNPAIVATDTATVSTKADFLNALANGIDVIQIPANTTITLDQSLVLSHPVKIVGANATSKLLFSPSSGWSGVNSAILVRSGNVTLESISVRFDTTKSWSSSDRRMIDLNYENSSSQQPTDAIGNGIVSNILLSKIDVDAPAGVWVIRGGGVQDGRIIDSVFKGGVVDLWGGPWFVDGNKHLGTRAGEHVTDAFAGHGTHDLTFTNNEAYQGPGSGVTNRLINISGGGYKDNVSNNHMYGSFGSPNLDGNLPEAVLTESYRPTFEGKPVSVSSDGRILRIPLLRAWVGTTGNVVAILDGPNAGSWYRVAQVLGTDGLTYLMDDPLPTGDYTVSIVTGFVLENFSNNIIDLSETIGDGIVLAGNHFGTQVKNNTVISAGGPANTGGVAFRIESSPTEQSIDNSPNYAVWGWTHTLMLGLQLDGNTVTDSANGWHIWVGHGNIWSNNGRVYMDVSFTNNQFSYTSGFLSSLPSGTTPIAYLVGESYGGSVDYSGSQTPSPAHPFIDAGELRITDVNNGVTTPGVVALRRYVAASVRQQPTGSYQVKRAISENAPAYSSGNSLVVDDGDADYTQTGVWQPRWTGSGYQSDHTTAPATNSPGGAATATATWTFNNLETGQYRVWVTWLQADNRASDSPFSVFDGATSRGTVRVDQRYWPSYGGYESIVADGAEWRALDGVFDVVNGQLVVKLGNNASNNGGAQAYVVADGVRITRVSDGVVDDGDADYTQTGVWQPRWTGSGYQSDHTTAPATNSPGGAATATATWTFNNLETGQYRVWVTWLQADNRASDSPFSVFDGATSRGTVRVDQRYWPSYTGTSVYIHGAEWRALDGVFNIANGQLVVKLGNNASNNGGAQAYVVADGVRITRVGPLMLLGALQSQSAAKAEPAQAEPSLFSEAIANWYEAGSDTINIGTSGADDARQSDTVLTFGTRSESVLSRPLPSEEDFLLGRAHELGLLANYENLGLLSTSLSKGKRSAWLFSDKKSD